VLLRDQFRVRLRDVSWSPVLANENLLQRGNGAAPTLDSVAAYAKLISREILLGEGEVPTNVGTSRSSLTQLQATIARTGPSEELLYRAMNGFTYDEKGGDNRQAIPMRSIRESLAMLRRRHDEQRPRKFSGHVADSQSRHCAVGQFLSWLHGVDGFRRQRGYALGHALLQ
jgi:hypothetical protein